MAQLRFKELFHLIRVNKANCLYKVTLLYNQLIMDIKMAGSLLNVIISVIYLSNSFVIGILWQIAFHHNGLTRIIALFVLFFTCYFHYTMYWMASSICMMNMIIVKLLYSIQFDEARNTRLTRLTRCKIDSFVARLNNEFVGFRCLYSIKFTKLSFFKYILGLCSTYILLNDLGNSR